MQEGNMVAPTQGILQQMGKADTKNEPELARTEHVKRS